MRPIKENFDAEQPLAPQISIEWLYSVARMHNQLNMLGGIVDPTTWTIIPGASGTTRPCLGAKVGGKTFTKAVFEGTESDYAKVYLDAVTYPTYTDEATYNGDWPSDYVVIRLSDVSGYYILPRG